MKNTQKTALIFDDDEDILFVLSSILKELGWKAFYFTNCNNVIDKVNSIAPDIIFMDNWIPGTGGVIATQTLKQSAELKDIPVIYFSANNNIHSLAAEAGADTYLAKPFELADLNQVLELVYKEPSQVG